MGSLAFVSANDNGNRANPKSLILGAWGGQLAAVKTFTLVCLNVKRSELGLGLGRCKQKQRGLRGLLCRWPSVTEWEMDITAQGYRLRNDLYCVEWNIKLYYTIL